MILRAWRPVLAFLVLLLILAIVPTARADGPGIDLRRDSNRDGVPDALAVEVNRIARSPDKMAAIADLVNRLPYTPETRAL